MGMGQTIMTGTLYGVGLGPGDPELMTLKAVRIIRSCPVVAWPAPDDGVSFARSIAADVIADGTIEIPIVVPMRVERFPATQVYDKAGHEIAAHLDAGRDVALLCEGDPFFYGSFMYLHQRLSPHHRCEIVPGVSSVMAAAAALARPIAARNDTFTVIPAPLSDELVKAMIQGAETFAIMKIGRHFNRIRSLLETLNLVGHCGYAERVTLGNADVRPLALVPAEHPAPYFSIILGYRGSEQWSSS
jgi:precorrin-2/cobalt-factor-2 C20-methyltransferase